LTTETISEDTTVYAGWKFTLNFDTNGGSEVTAETYTETTDVDFSEFTTTKDGYTFNGWYKDKDLTTKLDKETISKDTTVYAGWKFTLNFVTNGGSEVTAKTYTETTDVDFSEFTTTKDGYTFNGWYKDEALTTKLDKETISKDTTVYAGWKFTLNFVTNGGSEVTAKTYTETTDVDFSEFTTTKDGYTFNGWYKDEALTTKLDKETISKDTTVYAGWDEIKPSTVTLTMVYDPLWHDYHDLGLGDTADVTREFKVGDTVDMEEVGPGYKWDRESGVEATRITQPFVITEDTTVYAEAKNTGSAGDNEKTVTLTLVYDPLWKYTGGDMPDKTYTYKVGTVVDVNDVDGSYDWYEEAGNKDTLITSPFTMNEDKTIYAGEKKSSEIFLEYNALTGHMSEALGGDTFYKRMFDKPEAGKTITVDLTDTTYIPTREGYVFTGWYHMGIVDKYGDTLELSENTCIYAGWADAVTLTLVYDLKDTSKNVEMQFATGTEVDISTLVIPGHEDENPISWSTVYDDPTTIVKNLTMDTDKTIYAVPTAQSGNVSSFKLTFESNGGSTIEEEKFTTATEVNFEADKYKPTREGYTFTGWYEEASLQTKLTTATISEDTTVYAGWEEDAATPTPTPTPTQTATPSPSPTTTITTTTTTTTTTTKTNIKTGDESNLALWVALLLLSGVGEIVIVSSRKKRSE
jgi:uncharacterized repeat protein (TIGR02543 family)